VVRALTESPDCGFEAAYPHLREKDMPQFILSPDPTHVASSSSESVLLMSI
jgi:hypothetical protein